MIKAYQMRGVEQIATRHQLGICQCQGPQCMDTISASDMDGAAIHHPIAEPYGDALYWGVVIFVGTLTCGVVGCIAGVLYSTFGG